MPVAEYDPFRFVGQEAEPPRVSRYLVNDAMIRNWVEALGDDNSVYTDPEAARATGRPDIICPPAMISTWTMAGLGRYRQVQRAREAGEAESTPYSRMMHELDEQGFTSVVATDIEQEYLAEVHPGTRVTCHYMIEDVSALKRTALGEGHFITLLKRYRDADGAELVKERFRMLRFRPVGETGPRRPSAVPPIIRTLDNTFWFDAACEGRLLIQRCVECGTLRHPPGPYCPECRSPEWDAVESSRRGTLHSWTLVHHPQDPAFTYPHAVGLVDLEEGTRLVADFEQIPQDLEIGMPVHIVFGEHEHGESLPFIRPGAGRPATPDTAVSATASADNDEASERDGAIPLPVLDLVLDRTAITAGAIASQDFEDVHHDPAKAQSRGLKDIFLSINTTNGLIDRYLTDWGGPGTRVRSMALRLGVPHLAGDTLTFTGTARRNGDDLEVAVVGSNAGGVHVSARARVTLRDHDDKEGSP